MSNILSREVRKYVYGVALAFVPVAAYFGWLDAQASVLAIPLLLALLNLTPEEGAKPEPPGEA